MSVNSDQEEKLKVPVGQKNVQSVSIITTCYAFTRHLFLTYPYYRLCAFRADQKNISRSIPDI
jgi:hypothetical protein